MSDEKTIRKLKKLARRIHTQMESVKDTMEDLEIEFEVLKATVKRLKAASVEAQEPVEETDEDMDIENSSNITVTRKF